MRKTILSLLVVSSSIFAMEGKTMTVYKSPYCGCCEKWIDIMKKEGFKIKTIDTGTTVQLVVLLVDKIPDGVATVDYAMNVGNAWGVGNGENGLVLVIAAERKMASAPAERLEGNYPDITSNHILQELKPFLKDKEPIVQLRQQQ